MLEAAKSKAARVGGELEELRRKKIEILGAMSSQIGTFGSLSALGTTSLRNVDRRIRELAGEVDRCKADALRDKSDLLDRVGLASIFDKISSA